jgi:hypothetical protein
MGLRGAVAILTIAAFEAFLKDEFTRCVDAISPKVNGTTFCRLPDRLRVANTFNPLDVALRGPRYGLPSKKVHRLPDIKRVVSLIHTDRLIPEAFGGGKGNPSSDCLKELCTNVDITDIFRRIKPRFEKKWGGPVSHSFVADKLDEIVQRRHRLAHGMRGLVFSRKDLREGLRFVRILCEVLDMEVRQHFREIGKALR